MVDAPREKTEPGAGEAKPPSRERTVLGVAPPASATAPTAPIVTVRPGRERTILGMGDASASPDPAPKAGAMQAEKSIAVDLVVKKREVAPPSPEPELSWPEPPQLVEPSLAETSEDEMPETEPPEPRRRRRLWPWVLLLLLAAAAAVVYLKRDRIPWWTLRARAAAIFR
jgi:hypothetical protein